jgi:hypothetical protein
VVSTTDVLSRELPLLFLSLCGIVMNVAVVGSATSNGFIARDYVPILTGSSIYSQ